MENKTKGFTQSQASIAGYKSGEVRRKMKAYKEQHRATMISKAEELVCAFMENKPVFGIDLKPEIREKIIESVLAEVTTESLVGALKHRDNVELLMLRYELLKDNHGPVLTGIDALSNDDSEAPAMTNTELMRLMGTHSEAKSRLYYDDPLNGMPDFSDLPDFPDQQDIFEEGMPELFFDWYKQQPDERQDLILETSFHGDIDQLLNHAGRSTKLVASEFNINLLY